MRLCEFALLICVLLVTTTTTGDLGGVVPAPISRTRESWRIHRLQVVIYLNTTTCSAAAEASQTFPVALESDLLEGIFHEISLTREASYSSQASSGSVSCDIHCISSWDAVATEAYRGRGAVCSFPSTLLCKWEVDEATSSLANLHVACQRRVWELYTTANNATEAKHANSSSKYIFRRSSEVYYNLTGDRRHLVAVGGDCYRSELFAASASSNCGRVLCLGVAMIVLAAVVALVLVVAVVYVCHRQLFGRCFLPSPNGGEPTFSSQLVARLADDNEISGNATYEPWKRPVEPSMPFNPPIYVSLGNFKSPLSRSSETMTAYFLKTGEPTTNVSPKIARTVSTSGQRQDSAPASIHLRCHHSTPRQYEPPHVDGVELALHGDSGLGGWGAWHSERSSPIACEVDISKEEREQLLRQRSWLREHVTGLDTL
ncbi:hypothetical protein TraAM80_05792 [Trypanosoma rangeli]|uniref:Uncharacterized protein n=1 Tax=Trypanosoma rangeli TaxID=5698 RepID=A0A3R7K924_TRYRA|nr:uncharacterized protein TraAM80_05792 [Trypanosoma rangeli]RNF03693.1 hypothetical protein TraAM80_05792 [Trypanosoma rangeli]|eukprot:RNF03693.1 hypothetical protein TraAM80_05792 [Trypanosoma rangeli]